MVIGDRVAERLAHAGISQGELARRVGVSQPTINNLINRSKKGSTHLHKIARVLGTTAEYLTGEIDDPDKGAPIPAPVPETRFVMLPVALPSERALGRMFEGLLDAMPPNIDEEERARLLARWLPIGLAQLRDLLPSGAVVPDHRKELAEALATHDREVQP